MKLKVITLTEEEMINRDYCSMYALEIDDQKVFCVHDGEPEDNTLSRNFSDVYSLANLLQKAYNAGKNNEPLEIVSAEVSEY